MLAVENRVILLYTQLCSLRKSKNEDVTDYIIRGETIAASLKSTGAQIDDAFLIAIVLKGLPNEYHTFSLLITQSEKEMSFQEFKVSLRNFEENEKAVKCENNLTDHVMHPMVEQDVSIIKILLVKITLIQVVDVVSQK